MSRIVVATDSFKGSLTSKQAAQIIADALVKELSDVEVIQCPLADGGEGTAEILSSYLSDDVCMVESAQLIGLNVPAMRSLDVMERGSAALGAAVIEGLDAEKRQFVIGLGGSATNDCGLGMLMALGLKAFDAQGVQVEPNLAGVMKIHETDLSGLDPRLAESRFTVLSDVISPLTGKNGATSVYGPQKGVRKEDAPRIDAAMTHFAEHCGKPELMDAAGAGAAGGLGFAMMLLGGEVISGADDVMERTGCYESLDSVDWVVTGEGCSDLQTLQGKLPMKVAEAARERGVKVALLSGSVDQKALPELGRVFDVVISAAPGEVATETAMQHAGRYLAEGARRVAERMKRDH